MTTTEILTKLQRYCAYQDRCSSEVLAKLRTFQLSDETVQDVLQCLKNDGFVDDERYIESFIRGKMNSKQWGKMKIRMHLIQKSLPASIVDDYLNKVEDAVFIGGLQESVEKWIRSHGSVTKGNYPKIVRHLMTKGYGYEQIAKQLKDFEMKHGNCQDVACNTAW